MRSTTLPRDQQDKAFHFPMKADDLALISELDFAGACRSLVMRSRELNILGMTLRQCPEVGMHACMGDLFIALHDLFLLLSSKPVIRLIHSVQTGIEYLVNVCDRIPSQVIPSFSDNEAELGQEGSIEEDELDVSNLKTAFHCRFIRPNITRPQQFTMHKP